MKVYFEKTGISSMEGKVKLLITIFVNPKNPKSDSTEAYQYNPDGKKFEYAWANPIHAKQFDSKELPDIMWQSIRYGCCKMELSVEKEHNWTLDDLEYEAVDMDEIKAYKQVMKKIKTIKTIDEFKKLYPLFKKGNRINVTIIKKLFELYNVEYPCVINGEIGIAFYYAQIMFNSIVKELGLE